MAIEPGRQWDDYILVHRGIRDAHHQDVLNSGQGLGTHWSSSEDVARGFAEPGMRGQHGGWVSEDDPEELKSTRLSGYVHKDDVMTEDEIREWNKTHSILHHSILTGDAANLEKEVSVRPGASVHITRATDLTNVHWNGRWFEDSEVDTDFDEPKEYKA